VPAFGDPRARILIVGLAPGAHGANRTGRLFTGDRSADFLFASLHRTGLANQPASTRIDDGLRLKGAFVSAVGRCAPPGNRPTPDEIRRCLPFLAREITRSFPKTRTASVDADPRTDATVGSLLAHPHFAQ
jgi:uracil-DNA glycosylase family 4